MTSNREQFDEESPDRWIERQLRRIPLPSGLLRRLRRIAMADNTLSDGSMSDGSLSDGALDAALRNVPLPHDLWARLQRIAVEDTSLFRDEKLGLRRLDDDKLDAALCDVTIPEGLTDRLTAIADADAEKLAGQLREVAVPSGMLERLSQIPTENSPATVSASTVSASAASSSAAQPSSKRAHSVTTRRRPRRSSLSWQWASGMALSIALLISLVYYGSQYLRPTFTDPTRDNANSLLADALDNARDGMATAPSNEGTGTDSSEGVDLPIADSYSLAQDIDDFWSPQVPEQSVDPAYPDLPKRENENSSYVITGDPAEGRPSLDVVDPLQWRGVRPPWVDAEALTAQMRTGFHPFVSPADHNEFRTRRLPLHAGRGSYDWVVAAMPQQRLSGNQLKRWREYLASRVRTEDFINAVDYPYPPPRDRALALRAYGGTSPFGTGNMRLLQLGIQAAPTRHTLRPPTHLIVLVDTSASMVRNNKLIRVQRALRRLLGSLEPLDRVSIVTTSYRSPNAGALIENVGSDELSRLQETVASIQAAPTQDSSSAIRLSNDLARKIPIGLGGRRAVVWLTDGTDGIGEASESWQEDVQRTLREINLEHVVAKNGDGKAGDGKKDNAKAGQNIDLQVIDVANGEEIDSQLVELLENGLRAGGGRETRVTASDTESIFWALSQSLTGKSQVVAYDTEVEITFDAETVVAYRLFGHEATTIVGQESESLRMTMHASEATTVLFELQLNSTGSDTVATAKLTWRDANTNQTEEQTQRISRWQFVPSFEESALPLQAATIAAAAAESLRQSVHTSPANLSIGSVRRLAWDVHPQVAEDSSFERLIRLLSRAEEAGL